MKVRIQNMRDQSPHTVVQPTRTKEEEKKECIENKSLSNTKTTNKRNWL
jgi:hypothetical protein